MTRTPRSAGAPRSRGGVAATAVPATEQRQNRGSAAPAAGLRSRPTELNEEHQKMLISHELAQERIRDLDREIELMHTAARVRAMRRARRDAHVRAARLRRLLLNR